jgi:sec-independent protein translocase protein TatA
MATVLPLLAFLPDIGGGEMVVVLLIVLMLFGGDKMPQLAKGLGKSLREFKKAASGVEQEFKKALDEVPDPVPPPKPRAPYVSPGPPPAPVTPPAAPVNRLEPPPAPPAG